MLVLAPNLVLTEGAADDPRLPLLAWRNIVTADNLAAESEAAGKPAVNLANPDTSLAWRAAAIGASRLTVTTDTADDLDYVALARHNLASAGVAVAVEGKFAPEEEDWTELVPALVPPHDKPLLFRLPRQPYHQLSLSFAAGAAPPEAAVLYVGRLTAIDPGIELGFTPLPFGVVSEVAVGRSVGGEYLGEIEESRFLEAPVTIPQMRPDWFRAELEPLIAAHPRRPFFYAWSPATHPHEVAYAWLEGSPKPRVDRAARRMSVTLEMAGIVS
jgi:hypothetical protein